MIVDTSAIVALVNEEPEAETIKTALLSTSTSAKMSAATYLECGIVVDGRALLPAVPHLDRVLQRYGIEVVSFTPSQAKLAREAYRRYGKGSGHRAGLNFGDCISYALAIDSDEPLLCNGEDFRHTDVEIA